MIEALHDLDEIVSLREPGTGAIAAGDPSHVDADRWHALLDDPDVLVVDVRNRYETRIGQFEGACDPGMDAFHEFPERMTALIEQHNPSAVAMYCTGGIRCEKAAVWVEAQGIDRVYQLDGGILGYLDAETSERRWRGECFVFDKRLSVGADRMPGHCVQCHNCREPLTPDDRASNDYEPGVSCPMCAESLDDQTRQTLRERAAFMSQSEET